ncbi:MAG: GTP-binding protein, partial [Acetobacteraceae bacterium]|nr:GTP-binding protein [Acetobacteraceae bacterium]
MERPAMIPVVVVTGFLGSGKTTLIGRVLRDPAFARTAVIVNEFGEIGLDHDLIAISDETLMALTTGCLCCAVRSDLVQTLLDLQARRQAGNIPPYDRVLIETSGLADPAPILQALITDRGVAAGHRVQSVITLVDAVHGAASLERHSEARRQVALADRLVLTKTDMAAPTDDFLARLGALNPGVEILTAISGHIAPEILFATADPGARAGRLTDLPASGASPFQRGEHNDAVESFVLERDEPVPGLALVLLLEALAEHCGSKLLRVKGLVRLAEIPEQPALIHGVQHIFAAPEFLPDWPSADHRTRIVFITQGVPRHFPARLLAAIEAEAMEETEAQQ